MPSLTSPDEGEGLLLPEQAAQWLAQWRALTLARDARSEFSARLSASLGVTYPERGLIRLNRSLLNEDRHLLEVVLCHELAHLVIFRRHGKSVRPHGPEWRTLMQAVGFEPNARLGCSRHNASRRKRSYRHTCPVCHETRTANRAMSRWRCPQCIEQGLEGILLIEDMG